MKRSFTARPPPAAKVWQSVHAARCTPFEPGVVRLGSLMSHEVVERYGRCMDVRYLRVLQKRSGCERLLGSVGPTLGHVPVKRIVSVPATTWFPASRNLVGWDMDVVKLGKKGQVSIPKGVLTQLGLEGERLLLVETTADGGILLRPAGVYPIETYSTARVEAFLAEDRLSDGEATRLRAKLSARQP